MIKANQLNIYNYLSNISLPINFSFHSKFCFAKLTPLWEQSQYYFEFQFKIPYFFKIFRVRYTCEGVKQTNSL